MNNDKENKFGFIWNNKNGLRKVSDNSLKIGMQLLENSRISIIREEGKDNNFIIIKNNILRMCDNNTTTEELLNAIENGNNILKGFKIYQPTQGEFKRAENLENDYICSNCRFQTCPKW